MDPIDVQRIVYALPMWLQKAMVKDPRIMVAGGFPRAIVAGETPKDHLDHESAVRLMLAVKKLDDWVIEDEWSNY